jgi:hypothetical protein
MARVGAAEVLVVTWGVGGVVALLGQALWRLTPMALEPLREGNMTGLQATLYVGWTLFNAYAEGYRGFQRSFAPRTVARAFHLARHRHPLHVALAPAYCMSLFHATRRGRIVAWSVLGGVVVLVTLVRRLPQPWRGIVDAGVVVGLAWGTLAILVLFVRALGGKLPAVDCQLPDARVPAVALPAIPSRAGVERSDS